MPTYSIQPPSTLTLDGVPVSSGTFNLTSVTRFFEDNGAIASEEILNAPVTKSATIGNDERHDLFDYPEETGALRLVGFFDPDPSGGPVASFDVIVETKDIGENNDATIFLANSTNNSAYTVLNLGDSSENNTNTFSSTQPVVATSSNDPSLAGLDVVQVNVGGMTLFAGVTIMATTIGGCTSPPPPNFQSHGCIQCFLTGTHILTDKGYRKVEELAIGDMVKTADGQLEAIKWIGHQTCQPGQVKNPLRGYPILIQAGALGDNIPSRDLSVSPDHALLVEGLLINAGALVNDISILKTNPKETFVYYHVELENHALLVAEGAFAESYYPQKEDRMEYDNGAEYEKLYPHGSKLLLWPLDYSRVSSKNKVPRFVKNHLNQIALELSGEGVAEAV